MIQVLKTFKQSIPALDGSLYKGQGGKVGVIGGSLESAFLI